MRALNTMSPPHTPRYHSASRSDRFPAREAASPSADRIRHVTGVVVLMLAMIPLHGVLVNSAALGQTTNRDPSPPTNVKPAQARGPSQAASVRNSGPARSMDPVAVELAWSKPEARPGDPRVLAVTLDVESPYHINPDREQLSEQFAFLIPTRVTLQPLTGENADPSSPSQELLIGPVQFPEPHPVEVQFSEDRTRIPAYEGRVTLYVPVVVGDSGEAGSTDSSEAQDAGGAGSDVSSTGRTTQRATSIPFEVRVQYQACDDKVCLPPKTITRKTSLHLLPAWRSGSPPEADFNAGGGLDAGRGVSGAASAELFSGFDASVFSRMLADQVEADPNQATDEGESDELRLDMFGLAFEIPTGGVWGLAAILIVAAAGGLMLNFTPCVLPVIPIKIMGLSHAAGNRARCFWLGAVMSLGVVAFWLGLGAVMALVAGFTATNQLFQYPWFGVGVGIVIAVMAVGMCGLFTFQLPKWVYRISPNQDSFHGSFGFGIMTAVLSTPCTAPFMGSAAAWATTQNPATTLATFSAIGAGMASPYFFLSAFPKLVEGMPRTGPASELIKQVMGLLMLAAASFFIGIGLSAWLKPDELEPNASQAAGPYWWLVAFFVLLALGWLAYRTFTITSRTFRRSAVTAVCLLAALITVSTTYALTREPPVQWVAYSSQTFDRAKEHGRIVVMDFTADWCLNCKYLEQTVLYDPRVVRALDRPDVVPMKVDITRRSNEAGYAMLAAVERVAIPLLVVFDSSGEEVFKSDAYTVKQVLAAIDRAGD